MDFKPATLYNACESYTKIRRPEGPDYTLSEFWVAIQNEEPKALPVLICEALKRGKQKSPGGPELPKDFDWSDTADMIGWDTAVQIELIQMCAREITPKVPEDEDQPKSDEVQEAEVVDEDPEKKPKASPGTN